MILVEENVRMLTVDVKKNDNMMVDTPMLNRYQYNTHVCTYKKGNLKQKKVKIKSMYAKKLKS